MKITKTILKVFLLSGVLFLASCNNEDPQLPKGDYENGILVSGEGSGAGSASISYVSDDYSTSENKIYNKVNNEDLGTYLQSIAFNNDDAYIIVDNQNTITAVNRYTFVKKGTITTGLEVPRHMAVVGDKGYVTNWGKGSYGNNIDDDFVAVVNLNTLEVEKTISVAVGAERIIAKNGNLYVSHQGGYGNNNIVSVINIATEKVTQTITVNDRPDELFFDNNNNLVVLCEGKGAWTGDETQASISKINLNDYSVSKLDFPEGTHPSQLVVNNNKLYYNIGNNIFEADVEVTSLPTTPLLEAGASYFYGLAIKDNTIFVADASFTSEGKLLIYDITTKEKVKEFDVALGASKIYFN